MRFGVRFVPSAEGDLGYYEAREQRDHPGCGGEVPGNRCGRGKQKAETPQAESARALGTVIGDYRVFYEIKPTGRVRVLAVGHKAHNDLFIRGKRIEI